MISDPVNAVLVDWWLERGAKVAVWTDEEAELCRLAAFAPSICEFNHGRGRVQRVEEEQFNERCWVWNFTEPTRGGSVLASHMERRAGSFDSPDFALAVFIGPRLASNLAQGLRLPAKFRQQGRQYARVVSAVSP